jgi:hypothetical protein
MSRPEEALEWLWAHRKDADAANDKPFSNRVEEILDYIADLEADSKRLRDLQAWLVDQLPEVLGHGDLYHSGREDAFALALDKLEEQL